MRFRAMAIVLLAGVLLAGGCGSDEGSPTDDQTTAVPTMSPSPSKHVDRPPEGTFPSSDNGAIVVESPEPGASVSSPVTISGTADVFEATVSIRILDAAGNEIARTFTTATCGSGCRGDFRESVSFEIDSEQAGTIEVFEESAENGSASNVVTLDVTLVP